MRLIGQRNPHIHSHRRPGAGLKLAEGKERNSGDFLSRRGW